MSIHIAAHWNKTRFVACCHEEFVFYHFLVWVSKLCLNFFPQVISNDSFGAKKVELLDSCPLGTLWSPLSMSPKNLTATLINLCLLTHTHTHIHTPFRHTDTHIQTLTLQWKVSIYWLYFTRVPRSKFIRLIIFFWDYPSIYTYPSSYS